MLWQRAPNPVIDSWTNTRLLNEQQHSAAVVLHHNWTVSFYSCFGAVVWRTFDLYCTMQRSVSEIKHTNSPADQTTIPSPASHCLTAQSAAFRVIVKGWRTRTAVTYSKVRIYFARLSRCSDASDLLAQSQRCWNISEDTRHLVHRQKWKKPEESVGFHSSASPRPYKKNKKNTTLATQLQFSPTVNAVMQPFEGIFTPVF